MPTKKKLGGVNFFGINTNYVHYIDDLEYIELPAAAFDPNVCETAVDLTGALGNSASAILTPVTYGPFDMTNATLEPTDPTTGFECFADSDTLQASQWFSFAGTGGTYTISSRACGTNPIPFSDTQFALYTGSCGNYTPIDCNDDIDNNLQNSTLTVETVLGQTYYLLVDSYGGEPGTYCLDITSDLIQCAEGEVGTYSLSSDYLCKGDNINGILSVDNSTYNLPQISGVSGHLWCISNEPLDPNVWPGDIPGISSTPAASTVVIANFPNVNVPTVINLYLTSVVLGGGTLIDPDMSAVAFNIDISNGCFILGESILFKLLPDVDPISAIASVEPGTAAGTINILLDVTGGVAELEGDPSLYTYEWSNGSEEPSLIGVPNAVYQVTITDVAGCSEPFEINGITSNTTDPATVQSLTLTPNPTTGLLNLDMTLEKSANVQVEVFNALGQLIETIQAGNTASLSRSIDLSSAATGLYTVRITMDNDTAVRRIAVQR